MGVMQLKTIKLKFVDFWEEFDTAQNMFTELLAEKYNIVISDEPDYIIYSVFGFEHLKYEGIRIFYTGENIRPDFNTCDYAIAFDWLNFADRYIRFPLYLFGPVTLAEAAAKHVFSHEDLVGKTEFCNYIYSNAQAHPARKSFFNLLSQYKQIDSGGKHLNNIGYLVDDKVDFQKKYKFSIAFENSSTSGYTTEKIVQAFAARTIPIYWGNPDIAQEFNTKSFINCHEYDSIIDVIKKVIELDTIDELYYEMLKEPILKDSISFETCNAANYLALSNFLQHIFDQEHNSAYRRQNFFWHKPIVSWEQIFK
jgi:hypothetical protein